MHIRDLVSHPPITVRLDETLYETARLMAERDCGAISVLDREGRLAGVVTDRDVCLAAFRYNKPLAQIAVREVMTAHVATIGEDDSVREALDLMTEKRVHRLPVVDAEGVLIGMLSLSDLATECAQPDSRLRRGPRRVVRALAAVVRSPRRAERHP